MAGIIRRLRRANKKAAKFKFTVTLQELQLITDEKWKPENLVISFMHRNRKISSRPRKWEQSFSDNAKCVLIWPEQLAENIEIVTTLYRSAGDDLYEDKTWTIVVEEVNEKGKKKAIAAVPLNVRLFILDVPEHKSELKLKLRPLSDRMRQCSLVLLLGSQMMKEMSGDDVSITSSLANSVKTPADETDAARVDSEAVREARREIDAISASIKKWSKQEIEETVTNVEKPKDEKLDQENIEPKVRPLWRVNADEEKRQSRRISTEGITTTTKFEVDSNSRPVPVPVTATTINTSSKNHLNTGTLTRGRSNSPRAPSREALPEPIVGESLLDWCQRVTDGYSNVKVMDFTKSWRNGLALCAILHTYRPELIGDYAQLDFSDRVDGRKQNIKKALAAAQLMGISDIPDENDVLTPDRKLIELLLQRIRRIVDGNMEDATPTSASDHRISRMFGISETEQKVVDMINKIREKDELENAVDYRDVPERDDVTPMKKAAVADEYDDDEAETSNLTFGRGNVSITMVTPGFTNIRASGRQASPSKRDELRKRARDLLEKSSTLPSSSASTPARDIEEKRREQARQILDDASNGIQNGANPFQRYGSNTDLKRIELVRPSIEVKKFKMRDPSPTLVRKAYPTDKPHVPAITKSAAHYGSNGRLATFDRVKRYGSMRSAELKDSLQQIVKQYGYGEPSVMMTPTRKFTSQWEKDVEDVDGTTREQEKIEQRIEDVEAQSQAISNKIRDTEKGSLEEETLLETFMRLTNEKNTLVGRQEYYNTIEQIRQTTKKIDEYARQLDELTKNENDYRRSAEEKSATDELMENYKKALDTKSTLVQKIFDTEEELKEDEERLNNLTLERASRFVRGIDQPVSASKRLMQWWKR